MRQLREQLMQDLLREARRSADASRAATSLRNKFRKMFGSLIWKANPTISVWDSRRWYTSFASRLMDSNWYNWSSPPRYHGFWKRRNLNNREPNELPNRQHRFPKSLRPPCSGLCALCVKSFFPRAAANRKTRMVQKSPAP